MSDDTPMDRLICGDVGYGKTEVAMRAAMRAVLDGKQVAVLAPTTILAFQHWKTFRKRFAPFPVTVEMVSRFRSPKEIKQVLKDTGDGKVDVLIGTHRLLSRDVAFRDLGLLVVDEEQRFGVAAKEKLKHLRTSVDALTLSATPIPRTLQMGLAGLRDMSVIETPPKDRLAIQTSILKFSTDVITTAIRQELARDGQVYFVHNRVESIYSLASLVQKLVPEARVAVAHGQMPEAELEKSMLAFVEGRADVLVATTIIENGLDIPRANTLIVNRADRYGLAQLYQLRGRVGRSDRRAYAYLLVPPDTVLSEIARKRLAAIREFSELGAGFRIAALDLELRGAGNLLGGEQSGHIEAVGLDLYVKLLEQAILELKGQGAPEQAPGHPQPAAGPPHPGGLRARGPPAHVPLQADQPGAGRRRRSRPCGPRSGTATGRCPRAVEGLLRFAAAARCARRRWACSRWTWPRAPSIVRLAPDGARGPGPGGRRDGLARRHAVPAGRPARAPGRRPAPLPALAEILAALEGPLPGGPPLPPEPPAAAAIMVTCRPGVRGRGGVAAGECLPSGRAAPTPRSWPSARRRSAGASSTSTSRAWRPGAGPPSPRKCGGRCWTRSWRSGSWCWRRGRGSRCSGGEPRGRAGRGAAAAEGRGAREGEGERRKRWTPTAGSAASEFDRPETVAVHQILVPTLNEARDIERRLRKDPRSFELLARTRSRGPEASSGGDMGVFARGPAPRRSWRQAAFALTPGTTSPIVATQPGPSRPAGGRPGAPPGRPAPRSAGARARRASSASNPTSPCGISSGASCPGPR